MFIELPLFLENLTALTPLPWNIPCYDPALVLFLMEMLKSSQTFLLPFQIFEAE